MNCPRCQQEAPADAAFCPKCGAKLSVACPQCGAANAPDNNFCRKCGARLTISAAPPATRFAAPQSYTPRHLAEKILTSKSALEGERKQVTVLFADLKGSMELLADRDPEEARKLLDPVLEHMMEAVHRYEGTVNQVMGDGIMALFGAPLAHEDHAVRACYAALRMQELVKRYAEDARRAHGVNVQIRVGLNSGEVVVRAIGSDLHMDYTAIGQTTHLAARMEQFASPGSILLTPATLELVEGFVAVKPLGPVPVKGLADAVEVFEVTGAGPARTRLQAAARRGLTRFVGRDAELEQLRRAQQLADTGHGQVAAVVGEAGVGKSRLVYEFTHSHRLHGWLVLESASVSYGKATSYLPVIDLLKGYFKIQDRDDLREVREKVTGKLLTLDEALKPTLPALLALLDVPVDDATWQALDPGQRRQRTLEAVRRLLLREAREQALLLIFEDLHWIDSETQAVLDTLVDSLGSARLLLLVNYRPEYQHAWGRKTSYSQMRLDALPAESAGELLDALLGEDPGLAPLKQLLVKRGNPFFLEETVRTLVETKALAGERGRYRLTQPVQAIQVPATVQAVLAARIDRLPPEDKRLLQVASVIGKDVPWALLQAIAELPDEALRRGLDRLQATEFLYETGLYPDLEYSFKHALTHEVAYGSLLAERRRALHARIVGAIEALYGDRLDEQIERLAHHALRGEVWDKALVYLRQAGAKALARSSNREALAYFEQALTALTHLPETRETLEQAIDVRFDLRTALWPLGQLDSALGYLREAESLANTLDDQRRLGWVSVYMTLYSWVTGQSKEARAFGQKAQAIAESFTDLPLEVAANYYLGAACYSSGHYQQAISFLRRAIQAVEGDRIRERAGLAGFPAVMARSFLAFSLADRGEFEEGITHGQEWIRIGEALDHPYSLVVLCWGLAYLHGLRGDLSHAIQLAERGRALAQDLGIPLLSPLVTGCLGAVYARAGRVADGLSLLQETLAAYESLGLGLSHSLVVAHLGEAYMLADRLEEALAFAGRALALARDRAERGLEAYALHLLGEIASHQDPPEVEKARDYYREAMGLAEELGMRPLIAHCHLGLGKLYRRTGQRGQAQQHLATATTMYREMDMRFWLEQAGAELGELK